MSDLIFSIGGHLQDAAYSLAVAHHKDGTAKNEHLQFARNSIAKALMSDAEGMPYLAGEEWLVDLITEELLGFDVAMPRTCAKRIVNELFKHLKPEEGK